MKTKVFEIVLICWCCCCCCCSVLW